MRRTMSLAVAAGLLGLGAASAQADHDRHVRYVVGGALIGAAVGDLVYTSGRAPRHYTYAPPRGTVVYHPAPPVTTVVYHYVPPHRGSVVYHAAAPTVVTSVPPGHRRAKRASKGRPRPHRVPTHVVRYYP